MENIIFEVNSSKKNFIVRLKNGGVEQEPKEIIVLGAIKHGIKKFDGIQKITQIKPEELNLILEQLEKNGFIEVEEKKGWLGIKIEISVTHKGANEVDEQILPAHFTRATNVLGLCALAIPSAHSTNDLPISVCIHGHPFREAHTLRIGWALEQALDESSRIPPGLDSG